MNVTNTTSPSAGYTFMIISLTSLSAVLQITIPVIVGVILAHPKIGWLAPKSAGALSKLLFYILWPLFMIEKYANSITLELLKDIWAVPLIGLFLQIFAFFLGEATYAICFWFLNKNIRCGNLQRTVLVFCIAFQNSTFLPLMFMEAFANTTIFVHPDRSTIYVTLVTLISVPEVVIFYSLGLMYYDFSKEKQEGEEIEMKNKKGTSKTEIEVKDMENTGSTNNKNNQLPISENISHDGKNEVKRSGNQQNGITQNSVKEKKTSKTESERRKKRREEEEKKRKEEEELPEKVEDVFEGFYNGTIVSGENKPQKEEIMIFIKERSVQIGSIKRIRFTDIESFRKRNDDGKNITYSVLENREDTTYLISVNFDLHQTFQQKMILKLNDVPTETETETESSTINESEIKKQHQSEIQIEIHEKIKERNHDVDQHFEIIYGDEIVTITLSSISITIQCNLPQTPVIIDYKDIRKFEIDRDSDELVEFIITTKEMIKNVLLIEEKIFKEFRNCIFEHMKNRAKPPPNISSSPSPSKDGNDEDANMSEAEKKKIQVKKILKRIWLILSKIFSPPILGIILGMMIALIPYLREFFFTNPWKIIDAFPSVISKFSASIMTVAMLITGANLGNFLFRRESIKKRQKERTTKMMNSQKKSLPQKNDKTEEGKIIIGFWNNFKFFIRHELIRYNTFSTLFINVLMKLVILPGIFLGLTTALAYGIKETNIIDPKIRPMLYLIILIESAAPLMLSLNGIAALFDKGIEELQEVMIVQYIFSPITMIVFCIAGLYIFCNVEKEQCTLFS